MKARRLAIVVGLLALVVGVGVAWARVGGGDSFSGGGGHGGGGDSDGAAIFELLFHLIRLCFYWPEVGVPLLVIVIGYLLWNAHKKHQNKDWDSGPAATVHRSIDLGAVRRVDPDFSQVLFEDFAFRLFSAAHRARGAPGGLDEVAPYVAAEARAALAERIPTGVPVHSVVVGAMRTVDVSMPKAGDGQGFVEVQLEFEANVTAGTPGALVTHFTVERWRLRRAASARTKPPGPDTTRTCPNCGAPWQATHTGTQKCAYCDQVVDNGRFAWLVTGVELASIDARPPTLTEAVPERGHDVPTYTQPDFEALWRRLAQDDPSITYDSVGARLRFIYDQLNAGWVKNDLAPARGVVSDALYDYLAYWTDAYRRQGLRNVLEGMRITHLAICKITRDRWYDALTIRIWGTGRDYVVREPGGDVIRGSRHTDRAYSEYWTLVRSAARRGPLRADPGCGNCGAPLVVTQAGACTHCGAHVTAGEFDWVLSKIEQDDSYRG